MRCIEQSLWRRRQHSCWQAEAAEDILDDPAELLGGASHVGNLLEGAAREAQLAVAYGVAGGVPHDHEELRVVAADVRHLATRNVEPTKDEVGEGRARADRLVRSGVRLDVHEVEDGRPVVARGVVNELDARANAIPAEMDGCEEER